MKTEQIGEIRVLVAESGYITQNYDGNIENRIFVKKKMLLPSENESDYKEVAEIFEYKITEVTAEEVLTELIMKLNDKGIIP